jgi:hypothetical protein
MSSIRYIRQRSTVYELNHIARRTFRVGLHRQYTNPCIDLICRFSLHCRVLSVIVLCSTVWFASAIAQAQELPGTDSKLNTTTLSTDHSNGWWSLEKTESPMHPRFWLNILDRTHIETGGLPRTSPVQTNGARATDILCEDASSAVARSGTGGSRFSDISSNPYPRLSERSVLSERDCNSAVNVRGVKLQLYPRIEQSSTSLDDVSLPPESFLYALQTNYLLWEQRLADTGSLTDEDGMLLYPLLQIDFASRRLPIVLYVVPLRGNSPSSR